MSHQAWWCCLNFQLTSLHLPPSYLPSSAPLWVVAAFAPVVIISVTPAETQLSRSSPVPSPDAVGTALSLPHVAQASPQPCPTLPSSGRDCRHVSTPSCSWLTNVPFLGVFVLFCFCFYWNHMMPSMSALFLLACFRDWLACIRTSFVFIAKKYMHLLCILFFFSIY